MLLWCISLHREGSLLVMIQVICFIPDPQSRSDKIYMEFLEMWKSVHSVMEKSNANQIKENRIWNLLEPLWKNATFEFVSQITILYWEKNNTINLFSPPFLTTMKCLSINRPSSPMLRPPKSKRIPISLLRMKSETLKEGSEDHENSTCSEEADQPKECLETDWLSIHRGVWCTNDRSLVLAILQLRNIHMLKWKAGYLRQLRSPGWL